MSTDAEINFSEARLVVFGCGYVGTAVALEGLQRGARVCALTRNEATATALRAQGMEVVVADLSGEAWHDKIPEKPDLLLNCVSSGGAGLEGYRHSYLNGMASISRWTQRHGRARAAVYTSSTSVYPQDAGVTVTEASLTKGTSDRGEILREAERLLLADGGVGERNFVLRLAGIYGPGRHSLLDQVRVGEVAGAGTHRLNLVHRDDIVAAVWRCFALARQGDGRVGADGEGENRDIYNLADDGAAPKAEIVAWLAARLGVPVPRFTGTPAAGRRTITPDRVIANGKAKAVLGWHPRYPTFREGYESLLSR